MAFAKNQLTPEEDYAFKVIDYFNRVSEIKDGEERYRLAIAKESFLNPILEASGSKYEERKKKIYALAETKETIDVGAVADAIIKIQQREARLTGIYGEIGIIAVPKRKDDKLVIEAIENDDIPATANMEV